MSYAMNSRLGSLEKWRRETEELLDQLLTRIALLEENILAEKKNKPNGKNDRARTARTSQR